MIIEVPPMLLIIEIGMIKLYLPKPKSFSNVLEKNKGMTSKNS